MDYFYLRLALKYSCLYFICNNVVNSFICILIIFYSEVNFKAGSTQVCAEHVFVCSKNLGLLAML